MTAGRSFALTSWAWLTDYPSTNGRIYASTLLAAFYVVVVVLCLAARRALNTEVMATLQWFLLVMMGLDVAQYVGKRATYQKAGADADSAPPLTPGSAPADTPRGTA